MSSPAEKIGGMDTLTEPPNADVRKVGTGGKGKRDSSDFASPAEQIRRAQFKVAEPTVARAPAPPHPPPAAQAPAAAPLPPRSPLPRPPLQPSQRPPLSIPRPSKPTAIPVKVPVRFKLHVARALWAAPDTFAPEGDEVAIGRVNAGVLLEGERFCHPREALLQWRDGKL